MTRNLFQPRRFRPSLLITSCLCAIATVFSGCSGGRISTDEDLREAVEEGTGFIAMYDLSRALTTLRPAYAFITPEHELYDETVYSYAIALWHFTPTRAEYITEAEAVFKDFIANTRSEEFRRQAQLDYGRILEVVDFPGNLPKVEEARPLYISAYEANPNDVIGETAIMFWANTYLKEFEVEASVRRGIELLENHLAQHPEGPLTSVIWQTLGNAYVFNFNDEERALTAYEKAYALGFADVPRKDRYLWLMGRWATALGDYDRAVTFYTAIVEETPRSVFGTLARDFVAEVAERHPERNIRVPRLQSFGDVVVD